MYLLAGIAFYACRRAQEAEFCMRGLAKARLLPTLLKALDGLLYPDWPVVLAAGREWHLAQMLPGLKAMTRRLSPDLRYCGISRVKLVSLYSSPSHTSVDGSAPAHARPISRGAKSEERLASATASCGHRMPVSTPIPFSSGAAKGIWGWRVMRVSLPPSRTSSV